MNNILNLFIFELKINYKLILSWLIGLTLITMMYMGFFPYVQEMAEVKLEMMPKELLQLFNMDDMSDLSKYNSYYGMFSGLITVASCCFAAILGCGLINKEEKNKSIEFMATVGVNRSQIYITKALVLFITLLFLGLCISSSSIKLGAFFSFDGFVMDEMINISKYVVFIPFIFGFISFGLASINYKLGNSGINCAIVLVSYLTGYLSTLLNNDIGDILKQLSPFQIFGYNNILANDTVLALFAYLALIIVFIITGYITYRKRNFTI